MAFLAESSRLEKNGRTIIIQLRNRNTVTPCANGNNLSEPYRRIDPLNAASVHLLTQLPGDKSFTYP